MRHALLVIACSACWTGSDPASVAPVAAPPRAAPFSVTVERTACLGACHVYTVTIRGDRSVTWNGVENVASLGTRTGHVSPAQLDELSRELTADHFFERDDDGSLPDRPICIKDGNRTTCNLRSITICGDTSSSIITVQRAGRSHRVVDAHCKATGPLDPLEHLIDQIANTAPWIGP